MSPIADVNIGNAFVKLDGVGLQINDSGFSISGTEIVDWAKPWLTRDYLIKLRDDDDSLSFEMTNIYGKRTVINYLQPTTVPLNNNENLSLIYAKILRKRISLTGQILAESQAADFYTKYSLAQTYWAKRAILLQQLGDSDITKTKVTSLIQALTNLDQQTSTFGLTLTAPVFSGEVIFAEGSSCQFNAFVEGIVSSFSFNLIQDTLVEF